MYSISAERLRWSCGRKGICHPPEPPAVDWFRSDSRKIPHFFQWLDTVSFPDAAMTQRLRLFGDIGYCWGGCSWNKPTHRTSQREKLQLWQNEGMKIHRDSALAKTLNGRRLKRNSTCNHMMYRSRLGLTPEMKRLKVLLLMYCIDFCAILDRFTMIYGIMDLSI